MTRRSLITVFAGGAGNIELPDGWEQSKRRFVARSVGTAFDIQAQGTVAEIDLYDEIGFWGITANDFKKQLRGITAEIIRLNINSPGGDVFDGIAMYNDLVDHPARIEVNVTGLAASAASLIAMSGDRVVMAANAFMMIHNAWGLTIGDRNDHREVADLLEKIDGALAGTYADRTGLATSAISQMMDKDTWLTAEEAIEQGFADEAGEAQEVSALFDLREEVFKNMPEGVPRLQPKSRSWAAPRNTRDAERILMHDAGLTRSQARDVMRAAKQAPDATPDAGAEADAEATPDAGFLAALVQLESNIRGENPNA